MKVPKGLACRKWAYLRRHLLLMMSALGFLGARHVDALQDDDGCSR